MLHIIQARSLMRVIFPCVGAVVLAACGQQGALFIPTEPAAANRATLTETLRPGTRNPASAASAPASSASSPSAPQ